MIDSHCHLTYPQLASQLPDVLARAAAAGVDRMITIGTDIPDSLAAVALCMKLPNIRCTVGIHPNHSADFDLRDIEQLEAIQANPPVLAIGETGLDYHYDRSPVDKQLSVFTAQLRIASAVNKPVVIHCREALDDTLAVMRDFPHVRAVFHCFTGTADEAKRVIDAGYYLGYTGPVTFKKSDELRRAVAITPLDRLLVETDAPYLTPEPMRKIKTNEPAFVTHTARAVANVLGVPFDELDEITTRNTLRFYGWD